MSVEHIDVLVVGAGLSGIGAAYHLQTYCPDRSYTILEARDAIGGTWDLFRYPGIRSDSDMHTLGYAFRPWTEAKAIADGPSILRYVKETARDYGIDKHIRFNHRVVGANWSSEDDLWTVDAELVPSGEKVRFTCNFLYLCSGYYNYDEGYTPDFKGTERFKGQIIHPQKWPEDLDYSGKRVIVIGSGATAVTLVPAMSEQAAHVTMLQRSPTYILSMPDEDAIANAFRKVLPEKAAYELTRWKNVGLSMLLFQLSRRAPDVIKKMIRKQQRDELGPDFDIDTHFKPTYNPWDQRLCLVPNADLFRAISDGKASVVTDHIDSFTENGIRLKSGLELEADIIITATGLNVLALGGWDFNVDGKKIEVGKSMSYKGMMLSDVPNLVYTVGYTNASWTLKADLTAKYICRLMAYMKKKGYSKAMPHNDDPSMEEEPIIDLASGYVFRALDKLPKQGSRLPWRLYQNYLLDVLLLRLGRVNDPSIVFSRPSAKQRRAAALT